MLSQGGFIGLQPAAECLLLLMTVLSDIFPGRWIDVKRFEVLLADILVTKQRATSFPFARCSLCIWDVRLPVTADMVHVTATELNNRCETAPVVKCYLRA